MVYMKDLTGYQMSWQNDETVGTSLGDIVHGGLFHQSQTVSFEPRHEKTCSQGFGPGQAQTGILNLQTYMSLQISDLETRCIIPSRQ